MRKMKILSMMLIFLIGLGGSQTVYGKNSVVVDRIENNYAVVEVVQNDEIKMVDLLLDDFNEPVREKTEINFTEVCGKFYNEVEATDTQGEKIIYYQFRSNNNDVWWLLTAEEIGEIPSFETEYNLIYFDNGTTAENKNCSCLPDWDCECEVYDDLFLNIAEAKK